MLTKAGALMAGATLLLSGCTLGSTQAESASPSPNPAATSSAPADLTAFYTQTPDWSDCGDGFFCAAVEVPLDYDDPGAGSLQLQVNRRPADDPDARIGSLLVNPGGPGSSGLEYAQAADRIVTRQIRAAYDIVGFDPRGVGSSEPLECIDDAELDELLAFDGSPDTPEEEQAAVAITQNFISGCEAQGARLLPHIGTKDAARDIDIIRAVVGDTQLHYFGASYGTFLGATYAGLFPERVGRMVLDGAVDPAVPGREVGKTQAVGFEQALAAFIDDCYTRNGCPLVEPKSAALQQIEDLFAAADRQPLSSQSGRPVTESLVVLGVITAMYDETSGWPILRDALDNAFDGDGGLLLALADIYADRQEDGSYANNANEVIVAVNCLDRPQSGDLDSIRADAVEFAAVSPRFGEYIAWGGLSCINWPVRGESLPAPITAAGAEPILVVGTTRDPATPYQWSINLAGQLQSGSLLTYDGDGHTAYTRGSRCIDDAVDEYLLTGTLPPPDTVCT